jgi:hypothetical protein
MIKYPLLYLIIYYKIRGKKRGMINISKSDFRSIMAKPFGINSRMAEYLLRDLKRYKMIKEIGKGKHNRIEFVDFNNNCYLFNDLVELRKVGLI